MGNTKINGLEKLKKIGAREISKTTHIDEEYLEKIISCDYEALKNHNAKGFIKILEREYEVDLSHWLASYEEIRGSVEASITSQYAKPIITSSNNSRQKNSNWWLWMLILVVLLGVIFYFKLYQIFDFFPKILDDKNRSVTYSQTPVISKVEETLQSAGIKLPQIDMNSSIVKFVEDKNDTNATNLKPLNALDKIIALEHNASEANKTIDNNQSTTALPNEATIRPSGKIWIGIIDLKSGKKTTLTTGEPYTFALDSDLLVLTGHGIFSLEMNGKEEKINKKAPMRFLVKDSNLTKISYEEFLKLNKGRAW